MKPEWMPDWSDETCIIVASGPSVKNVPLEKARGKAKFVAINNSWKLAPWADILYACDFDWWKSVEGLPEFPGLKITGSRSASQQQSWNLQLLNVTKDDRLNLTEAGTSGGGGHGGFQTVNMVLQFGCRRIILTGFDLTLSHGVHWHGSHPKGMNNPTPHNIGRMRRSLDNAKATIAELGAKVINASLVSELTSYPKMTFEAALEEFEIR